MKDSRAITIRYPETRICEPHSTFTHILRTPNPQVSLDTTVHTIKYKHPYLKEN